MKHRFKKIYKKYGVYCEDICDEIQAKKQNNQFDSTKVEEGDYGLFYNSVKKNKKEKKKAEKKAKKMKKKNKKSEMRGQVKGNEERRWIFQTAVLILTILLLLYIYFV